jgi:ubiquitin-conjugating enzyme E2 Z
MAASKGSDVRMVIYVILTIISITTDNGRTRFNPNLYSNGKVCLSILGTWSGPGWTQIQTMLSTLLSIQSLMNPNPYHNEPGYEVERQSGDVEKYNQVITHETIRVAVCGMLENPTCGERTLSFISI